MPSLGVAMTEGTILRWCKQPGDPVAEGETLLEIETDKTAVEIASPASGVVGPLLVAEGDTVATGIALTHITETAAEATEAASVPARAPAAPATPALAPATPAAPARAPLVGRAPHTQSPRQRREARETQLAAAAKASASASISARATASVTTAPVDAGSPIDLTNLDTADLRERLRMMVLIREFESRVDKLVMAAAIPGGAHLSIGQEAVAVGIAAALEPRDQVACSHRSHHHALAKGLPPDAVMAELYGKATGVRRGRGGTMHLGDMALGFLGGNGIVGSGLGVAMGAALAAQLRASGQVAVGIFGDGGANTGRTWESVNLAAVWRLPLIVVCENNLYAVETPSESMTGGGSIAARAAGFGLPAVVVDGQDLAAMIRAVSSARERAAAGDGPTFIEARTYRYEGHSTGQVITYRTVDEVRAWRETRDPIDRLRLALTEAGALPDAAFTALVSGVRAEIDAAVAFAEASPPPDPDDATRDVTALDVGLGNH